MRFGPLTIYKNYKLQMRQIGTKTHFWGRSGFKKIAHRTPNNA